MRKERQNEMQNEMKRYRVELERKVYKDKMCIELSAKDICEAALKARDFMEKAYNNYSPAYIPYCIKSVSRIHAKYKVAYSNRPGIETIEL